MNLRLQLAVQFIGAMVALSLPAPLLAQPIAAVHPLADVTDKTLFSIPFFLNTRAPPPAEVHLYVSGNEGRAWSLYQRRQPHQNKFDFQAGEDGEYWFVVRTSDSAEVPGPSTPAEKVVIVDRADPVLSVKLTVGASGELIATYRADDANLNPTSLGMDYRVGKNEPWQPIPVDRRQADTRADRQHLSGRTSWVITTTPAAVEIRAKIADRAGNLAELQKPFDLNPQVTRSSRRGAGNRSTDVELSANAESGADDESTGLSNEVNRLPWLEEQTSASNNSRRRATETERAPADSAAPSGWQSIDGGWSQVPSTNWPNAKLTNEMGHSGTGMSGRSGVGRRSTRPEFAASLPGTAPALGQYAPPVANRVQSPDPPKRPVVQMTNSRRFNLDYDTAGVGPGGAARVELWITKNSGNTWQPYGLDRDAKSPFLVELDQEGLFGFRLLIHDQQGLSARPPQAGEEADLWVALDRTPPTAQLLKAKILPGLPTPTIRIQWLAEDANLGDRPIRLSYAPHPDGPWSEIASGLANTGSYRWDHSHPLPSKTYLQLEVQDRAGNSARDRLVDPFGPSADGPKGIIRRIQPL